MNLSSLFNWKTIIVPLAIATPAYSEVTVTISGTDIEFVSDTEADTSIFTTSNTGYLQLNGSSDLDGDGTADDLLVTSITSFRYDDSSSQNDIVVFNGSNAFPFDSLRDLDLEYPSTLLISTDLELDNSSTSSISANIQHHAAIQGASIATADGHIQISTQGGGPNTEPGIDILNSTLTSSGMGDITLEGYGGPNDGSIGIHIGPSCAISTNAAGINIQGYAGGLNLENIGVKIDLDATIEAQTGSVSIQGQGGGSNGILNHGVVIYKANISSPNNMISINGAAGGLGGPNNYGIQIIDGTIDGESAVMIDGNGSDGHGVQIISDFDLDNSYAASVTSNSGMVHIDGYVDRTQAADAHGVAISGRSAYIDGGNGVIINGESGLGPQNHGVKLVGENNTIETATSTIYVNGISHGYLFSDGVHLDNSVQVISTSGDVNFSGESALGRAGVYADSCMILIGGNTTGAIMFATDEYEIYAPVITQTSIEFRPITSGSGMDIGSSVGLVNLSQPEIDFLVTPEIILGDISTLSGDITIESANFSSKLTIGTDGDVILDEVNAGVAVPDDVYILATGSVMGGSSASNHITADNFEINIARAIGAYATPLLIDANNIEFFAKSSNVGGSGEFDSVHLDINNAIAWFHDGLDISSSGYLHTTIYSRHRNNIAVEGDVKLNDCLLSFEVKAVANFALGNSINLIDNDDSDAVTGEFNGIKNLGTVTAGGKTYEIDYFGDTGNDVTFERVK